MKKKIGFVDTVLRDAHQSLVATRMTTEEMLPVLELLDSAGYHALEVWGGATFDACLRFLNEDPWERLRIIRENVKNTKLQMLLRGQNLLGYKHYPDDVVDTFIQKSIENGIDIIRVFDALNDYNNLITSIKSINKYGGECQACICYTISDIHTIEYYVELAKKLESMGAGSLAIKDMSGILTPIMAFDLVTALKNSIKIPIEIHTHSTSGISEMTYLKSIEAGADFIDTCISTFAGGASQPSTEAMSIALEGLGYKTGLNLEIINQISDYFKPIKEKYRESGLLNPKIMDTDPNTLFYQIPGGMLSNLLSQLKEAKQENKYYEVLKEVPRVRAELGYPPLVTPLSQMVGTQSVMNVISGSRYKLVPKEIKDYVKGLYGRSPAPISDDIRKIIIGDADVETRRPADLLPPGMETYTKEAGEHAKSIEDVLSYALFPTVAMNFFNNRENKQYINSDKIQKVYITY